MNRIGRRRFVLGSSPGVFAALGSGGMRCLPRPLRARFLPRRPDAEGDRPLAHRDHPGRLARAHLRRFMVGQHLPTATRTPRRNPPRIRPGTAGARVKQMACRSSVSTPSATAATPITLARRPPAFAHGRPRPVCGADRGVPGRGHRAVHGVRDGRPAPRPGEARVVPPESAGRPVARASTGRIGGSCWANRGNLLRVPGLRDAAGHARFPVAGPEWKCPYCEERFRKAFGKRWTGKEADLSPADFVRYVEWRYAQVEGFLKEAKALRDRLLRGALLEHNFHGALRLGVGQQP